MIYYHPNAHHTQQKVTWRAMRQPKRKQTPAPRVKRAYNPDLVSVEGSRTLSGHGCATVYTKDNSQRTFDHAITVVRRLRAMACDGDEIVLNTNGPRRRGT